MYFFYIDLGLIVLGALGERICNQFVQVLIGNQPVYVLLYKKNKILQQSSDTGTIMEKSDCELHNHFALALKVAHSHLWMDYVTSNTVFNKKRKWFIRGCFYFVLFINRTVLQWIREFFLQACALRRQSSAGRCRYYLMWLKHTATMWRKAC